MNDPVGVAGNGPVGGGIDPVGGGDAAAGF